MARSSLWIVILCAGLAACSKPSPQAGNETSASDSAGAASLASELASEQASSSATADPLALKAGLWQVSYARPEMGYNSVQQICIDDAMGKTLAERNDALDSMDCRRHDVTVKDGATHIERVCTRNDTTITSHIGIRADGTDAFHQTMETIYDPAFAGHADTHTSADGKYLGDCLAGMKPGSIQMPDGSQATLR